MNKIRSFVKKTALSEKLFYLLLFLLPVNLGKHFIVKAAYVNGLLIDYLIPTIYIQDILILVLLFVVILEHGTSIWERFLELLSDKTIAVLVFFVFSVFLSTLKPEYLLSSYLSFFRLLIYIFVFFYVVLFFDIESKITDILKILMVSSFMVSLLGIGQFYKQSSVFDNYLVLGEQPYTFSTIDIIKENYFGFSKVPAYGLFRHPNVFAGYLVIVITLVAGFSIFSAREWINKKILLIYFLITLLCLWMTLSVFGFMALALGLFLILISLTNISPGLLKKIKIFILLAVFFAGFGLPFLRKADVLHFYDDEKSLNRRVSLLEGSYSLIKDNLMYGVGYFEHTRFIEGYLPISNEIRFLQPVHNIFILIFTESGVFAFIPLLLFILLIYLRVVDHEPVSEKTQEKIDNSYSDIAWILMIQVTFLGMFDHYFLTQHQTSLLFWTVFGFVFLSCVTSPKEKLDKKLDF